MNSDLSEQMKPDAIRISDLARELAVKAKSIIDYLPEVGITEKKTHSSSISSSAADKIRKYFKGLTDAGSMKGEGAHVAASSSYLLMSESNPTTSLRKPPVLIPSKMAVSKTSTIADPIVLRMPRSFTFKRGFVDFDFVFARFDWTLKNISVLVDFTDCELANYQALALLIQYAWFLTIRGCQVTFKYGVANSVLTKMLRRMGASDWLKVLTTDGKQFGNRPGQILALRRRSDVQNAINTARRAIQDYKVGFPDYLSL